MTTTLVVHEKDIDQVYNYESIEEMKEALPKIFSQSAGVKALTVMVHREKGTTDMTIKVSNE